MESSLALTILEKAVQRRYKRMLNPPEKLYEPWVDRVMGRLTAGLSALDAELPSSGWGANWASPTAPWSAPLASPNSFWETFWRPARDPNLNAFWARAEALPAFRAAPPGTGDRFADRRLTKLRPGAEGDGRRQGASLG
jgi:hypothetical protein